MEFEIEDLGVKAYAFLRHLVLQTAGIFKSKSALCVALDLQQSQTEGPCQVQLRTQGRPARGLRVGRVLYSLPVLDCGRIEAVRQSQWFHASYTEW